MIPRIDLPFGVPITPQTLGVMMAGCLLARKRGFLTIALFWPAVALAFPLLAGGQSSVGVFGAPSTGFLVGWPFGAAASGYFMRRRSHLRGRALLAGTFVLALIDRVSASYMPSASLASH